MYRSLSRQDQSDADPVPSRWTVVCFQMLTLAFLCCGCRGPLLHAPTPGEGKSSEAAAEEALVEFFEHLHAGEYAIAVDLYGGSYQTMLDHNPGLDPEDHAGLFQAACMLNGAVCLKVASTAKVESDGEAEGEFVFLVRFLDDDGSLFVQGPCCGGPEDQAQTEFAFRVRKAAEYTFLVIDPPVYQP